MITNLFFFRILQQLKKYFGLTKYLHQYILYYIVITKFLQFRKIFLIRNIDIENNVRKKTVIYTLFTISIFKELNSFYYFQKLFFCLQFCIIMTKNVYYTSILILTKNLDSIFIFIILQIQNLSY